MKLRQYTKTGRVIASLSVNYRMVMPEIISILARWRAERDDDTLPSRAKFENYIHEILYREGMRGIWCWHEGYEEEERQEYRQWACEALPKLIPVLAEFINQA